VSQKEKVLPRKPKKKDTFFGKIQLISNFTGVLPF
jgi:hypothetical protein